MILWTMQPIEVWKEIQEIGVYRCDPTRNSMPEFTEMYVKTMNGRSRYSQHSLTYHK